jgi:hypothetical protein
MEHHLNVERKFIKKKIMENYPGFESKPTKSVKSSEHKLQKIQSLKVSQLDRSQISIEEWDGIDHNDAPDYCDAYIVSATYQGYSLSDAQIEELSEDQDFVYQSLMDYLY